LTCPLWNYLISSRHRLPRQVRLEWGYEQSPEMRWLGADSLHTGNVCDSSPAIIMDSCPFRNQRRVVLSYQRPRPEKRMFTWNQSINGALQRHVVSAPDLPRRTRTLHSSDRNDEVPFVRSWSGRFLDHCFLVLIGRSVPATEARARQILEPHMD
jgi:hypothetical protein